MSPNLVTTAATGVLFEGDTLEKPLAYTEKSPVTYKPQIVWRNVVLFLYLHFAALYGFFLMFTSASILTSIFAYLLYVIGGLGITVGAHRLWSHKSYKAKLPLRIILMLFETVAFQNSVYEWARDHRVHHKFSETDADPHNSTRGFFFAHIGWLLVKKHPDVLHKGKMVDLSDLKKDPVLAFQIKYYLLMMPILCFLIPTCLPVYLWGETWTNAWFVATMFRYTLTLNVTWLVNSAAHFYGSKPYDKHMNPSQNIVVAISALGEGWHNYHHVFPWDYKTAELGNYTYNFSTLFIDAMAKIGWAYDLKTVSPHIIMKRAQRAGDGSYEAPKHFDTRQPHSHAGEVWGWDDKDLSQEDKAQALVINGKLEISDVDGGVDKD